MPRRASLWVPVLLAAAVTGHAQSGRAPTVSVEISGIQDPLLTNVRAFLGITELERPDLLSRLTSADGSSATVAEIERRHRAAPEQIRNALMPYGYYRPDIEATLRRTDTEFTATYRVDPGEPARLAGVEVRVVGEGREFPAIRRALDGINLAAGQQLLHTRYENAKSRLYDAAYDHGFLDAAWRRSELRVAADRRHADVHLVLDTGPRFFFGATTIEQEVLDPGFMAGFVDIREGDPYDVNRLLELQRTLSDADYFSRVEVRAPREAAGPEQRVPVKVATEPASPQKYSLGLGYGTDTGPRATLGVLWRRVNAHGHRLQGDLQVSAIEQAVGIRYGIPIRNYATDTLSFSATVRREEIGDADTDQISLGASQVVSWLGFRRRLYLQAEREQFSFGDQPSRSTDLVYPGITLSRERADDLRYARHGYSVRVDLRSGIAALLSDVSFSRLELSSRWTRGIAPRTRLLLRAEAGVLWTDDFAALPPSQRFFAGGDRSIRGYPYREVGPRDPEGNVIGGERLLTGSIELEHLFHGNYGGAVFVDAGDAFDDSPDIQVGAGVGFRWRSPIGMVRFDVAHPFDDPDSNYRVHLTIGANL